MKIQLTKLIAGPEGTWPKGTCLTLSDEFAQALIDANAAISLKPEIETPEAAPEMETAVIKTRRGKK